MMNQGSCLPKEPFMKLENGKAPILNYNLPQKACFSTYGSVLIDIPHDCFKKGCEKAPVNNYFEVVKDLRPEEIPSKMSEALKLKTSSPLLKNMKLLDKHFNLEEEPLKDPNHQKQALPYQDPRASVADKFCALATQDRMPVVTDGLGGYDANIVTVPKPDNAIPKIYIIEEYKTCSFLGDYGAGQTIQTFSLLPGEKTSISVKTYRDSSTDKTQSENLLDSMSKNSASELERFIEEENSLFDNSSETTNSSAKVSVSASASFCGFGKASADGSYSRSKSKTASRSANCRALNRALGKHVAQSNHKRNIEVNTSTSTNVQEGEEHVTVREIKNVNKSRVLNFVFRQLLQEYISITYLSNIRIAYTNGYMESLKVVDLEDLGELLDSIITPNKLDEVKLRILKSYCKILNYKDKMLEFIEHKEVKYGECLGINETEEFYRRKQVEDIYSEGGLQIKIPGVILGVQKNTLKTPEQRAELYKKVFGACCDVPQNQIIN